MPAIVSQFVSIFIIVVIAIFAGQTGHRALYDLDLGGRNKGTLHRRSYFYVGGEYLAAQKSAISFGQMYVEHLVPIKVLRPFPIVFIPGNGG
jgi:hypothetical protein